MNDWIRRFEAQGEILEALKISYAERGEIMANLIASNSRMEVIINQLLDVIQAGVDDMKPAKGSLRCQMCGEPCGIVHDLEMSACCYAGIEEVAP